MNTTDDYTGADSIRQDTATDRAERGTAGWEDAVRLQRWATPDHADFYALAGEIVATLYALHDLGQVLSRQVAAYTQAQQERGRAVYDDTRQIDPAERLQTAVTALDEMRSLASSTADRANKFWSAIGHIGAEDTEVDS